MPAAQSRRDTQPECNIRQHVQAEALLRQVLEALVQLRRPFIRRVPRGRNDLQCQISKVQQRP